VIGAVVLAAGAGSRYRAAGGGSKLLAAVEGRPLVEVALRAVQAPEIGDAVVVLGASADEIAGRARLGRVRPVVHPGWSEGMASSLRAGLAALDQRCAAVVVVLADAPRISPVAVGRVAAAMTPGVRIASAVYDGRRAHPVGLARDVWASLPERGEQGARLLGEPDALVACDDLPFPGDADTPEALG
jgi:nicotine blue oxidoreductase